MALKLALPVIKDIAKAYTTFAQLKMMQGYKGNGKPVKKIWKTGNLYNRIGSYNTAARMATMRPTKANTKYELDSLTLSLNFAPPGATYGKWVEWGNGTNNGYGVPRPFAKDAANNKELNQAINLALGGDKGPIKDLYKQYTVELDKIFK
jgi:hypothetical protein